MLELVVSMTIIGLLLPSIFAIYTFIIKTNKEIVARQNAIQQWYEFFERLNILMEDYTIDYEEYYNRQMVWCVWWESGWDSFNWNVGIGWYCTNFTAYGNSYTEGSDKNNGYYIYHCSTSDSRTRGKHKDNSQCGKFWKWQSYWQYAALFTDAHDYTSDEDDEELWYLLNVDENVDAIKDGDDIQELYLISHDWKRRLYFRRKNIAADGEAPHYKIQILRLRWFDAWKKHSFWETDNNEGLYDWKIDTWACDYSMWFECGWSSVGWAYVDYNLPENEEDGWVDFTQWSTNIKSWKIAISPIWDADLYRAKQEKQVNAYMRIMTVNSIYWPALFPEGSIPDSIKEFEVPLQTTINMKDFYRGYSD